jgi:DNA processing protein
MKMYNTSEILKSAVALSIISTPSKLGLWNWISGSPVDIVRSLPAELLKTQDIIAAKYSSAADRASEKIIGRCINKNIKIITLWDELYPVLLKEIHNPPIVLYVIGDLPQSRMISLVGTRNSDSKSEEITDKISIRAASAGYTIVSGMALGIDRSAHIGALNANGSTVAVLPGGVDVIYPFKNSDLYKMISCSGNCAIISEYPPGIGTGQKWTFAKRNRIISGLSEAVIVIQAPLKSGAMITAKYAIEQNRDLYVCPGNAFDEKYSGCNELIRQGAAIFSDMSDLFGEDEENMYGEFNPPVKREIRMPEKQLIFNVENDKTPVVPEFKTPVEIRINEELNKGVIDIDDFIRRNNFSADEVNRGIITLEIEGFISRRGNRLFKV